MDITELNKQYAALLAEIDATQRYQGQAFLSGDTAWAHSLERELRDMQQRAKELKAEIDSFMKPDVMV